MGKDKLKRFKENWNFQTSFNRKSPIPRNDHELKGKWKKDFFKNDNPIVLELGCGRGEYTINLAAKFPEKNFVGIDWKGARLWRGAKTAFEEKKTNVGFLRIQIQLIRFFFGPNEVDEIWITFPDPHPLQSGERKRLTSPRFLDYYRTFIVEDGIVNLKTDSKMLFDYTGEIVSSQNLEVLKKTEDVYNDFKDDEILNIKTTYENIWLKSGSKICYLQFKIFPSDE